MNYPKISIITPSYNQGNFIEDTIVSVLEQGYPNLEYLIIDGGSNDNTLEIIKKYEKHLTYWVSEKDNGQSEAINKGFKIATGTVINWLNSDDYYEAGSLMHVGEIFSDPDVFVYSGISNIFSANSKRNSTGTDVYWGNLEKTIGWARIDQPETFFRRSAIDEIGFLNENLHYVMDKDLWVRFLSKFGLGNIVKDDRLIAHFRLHEGSKTVSLQEKFDHESIDLYYTYAAQCGLDIYTQKLRKLFYVRELPLYYKMKTVDVELLSAVLEYFLLYKGLEKYAQNDYASSKAILRTLDKSKLNKAELESLKTVLFRMRVMPVGLKKILNKVL